MAEVAELEFLRRTLVEPGLLAPDHLDAWQVGWSRGVPLFAHLVEIGVVARGDAGTLGAVFKGYVKLPPTGLLGLLKVDAPGERSAERSGPHVAEDRSAERSGPHVAEDRSAERSGPHVAGDRSAERSGPHVAEDRSAERSTRREVTPEVEASRSSPALRAAIDAALSGLPMEPSASLPATASSRAGQPQVGDFVAGYQLRARLGQGARGVVFRAWASAQGRTVVIKLMPSRGVGGLASAAAQAGLHGRVRHPGVLKCLAAGEEDELTYLVFEDLYAVSLAEYLGRDRTLAPARVAQLGAEVATTLAESAAAGVVHGDLKPAHLLVFSSELRVKLTDFLAPGEEPSSRAYLAPERQGVRRVADVFSDMYSLGTVLHHAASGHPPAADRHPQSLLKYGVPGPLARVVARLMHERPDQRFPGWHAALDALIAAEPPAGRALAAPEDMSDRAAGDRA